jgi:hypothetical protein
VLTTPARRAYDMALTAPAQSAISQPPALTVFPHNPQVTHMARSSLLRDYLD